MLSAVPWKPLVGGMCVAAACAASSQSAAAATLLERAETSPPSGGADGVGRVVERPAETPPPSGGDGFPDRVVAHPAQARKALAEAARTTDRTYATGDGQTVAVELADAYGGDDTVARGHVAFLEGLVHGDELGRLTMRVVPAGDVAASCGAPPDSGVLACYVPALDLMVVPGEELRGDPGGVTTAYVVAHEYGHHIANHRSNAPFPTLDYGPKRWASETDVCMQTLEGRLSPGDQGSGYADNPGEAWAETYAQLELGTVSWTFTDLLRPTTLSLAAARLDVTAPWTRSRIRTFRGTLGARDRSDTHRFDVALDGALSVRLRGPRRANFDLALSSGGQRHGTTRAGGSRDRLTFAAACVGAPERMSVTVTRRSGGGSYTLRVRYAG